MSLQEPSPRSWSSALVKSYGVSNAAGRCSSRICIGFVTSVLWSYDGINVPNPAGNISSRISFGSSKSATEVMDGIHISNPEATYAWSLQKNQSADVGMKLIPRLIEECKVSFQFHQLIMPSPQVENLMVPSNWLKTCQDGPTTLRQLGDNWEDKWPLQWELYEVF